MPGVSLPPNRAGEVRVDDGGGLAEVQRLVACAARLAGLGIVERTKLLTAASELSRNMLDHAHGGVVTIENLQQGGQSGIRISFADEGPGIADIDRAMQDGYTTGRGMGLGLPGARRLTHEFSIASEPGRGTRVVITIWKR
jgi:serine/threonine-protein kinase RsbT